MVGIVGVALGALLVTSFPALGADRVDTELKMRLDVGDDRGDFIWRGLHENYSDAEPRDDAYIESDPQDGTYKLTLQGRRKARAKSACSAVAWVMQWDRDQEQWVNLIERRMTAYGTTTKKVSSTEGAWNFR